MDIGVIVGLEEELSDDKAPPIEVPGVVAPNRYECKHNGYEAKITINPRGDAFELIHESRWDGGSWLRNPHPYTLYHFTEKAVHDHAKAMLEARVAEALGGNVQIRWP
jgi:hypothetical protein